MWKINWRRNYKCKSIFIFLIKIYPNPHHSIPSKSGKSYQVELHEAKRRLKDLELLSKQREEKLEKYQFELQNANRSTEKYNEER